MIQSLRRMESAAERGGQRVTQATGRGSVDFFRTIQNPVASLHRHFETSHVWPQQPLWRVVDASPLVQ